MVYFVFFRAKPKEPTRLNLRADSAPINDILTEVRERQAKGPGVIAPYDRPLLQIEPPKKFEVFFIYNAHEWEAHEVLSLPMGASFQQVTERYQVLIKTSDASSFEFYEAAFKAILKRKESL